MQQRPEHEVAPTREAPTAESSAPSDTQSGWGKIQSQVARAVPRLREIATTTALLGPIVIQSNAWGNGIRGGC
jgi:hypothetical protein